MSRRYGYKRASTSGQIISPEAQHKLIEDYAARQGFTIDAWYMDTAESGTHPIAGRPAGGRLLIDLQKGDEIIIARLDRMSRSFVDFAKLFQLCLDLEIKLHIIDLNQVFDPRNPLSKMLVCILVTFAAYERDLIVARTKEAQDAIRAAGRIVANPRIGYKAVPRPGCPGRTKRGRIFLYEEPDHEERAICFRICDLRDQGYTWQRIVDYLNFEWKVVPRRDSRNLKKNKQPYGDRFEVSSAFRYAEAGWQFRADAKLAGQPVAEPASAPQSFAPPVAVDSVLESAGVLQG